MSPPFLAPTSEPKTYTGCCHCQATKFTVKLDKLEDHSVCNCSICQMNAYAWSFIDPKDIHYERQGPTTKYKFGAGYLEFSFCSTCGIHLGATMPGHESVGFNVSSLQKAKGHANLVKLRTLQDVDIWSLKTSGVYDGKSKDPQYKAPTFQGAPLEAGDKKVYQGNCHCGAVVFAARVPPLEVEKPKVNECNCSFCWRAGRIHCYPDSGDDVHISGTEHLTEYPLKPKIGAYFCSKCGTHLFINNAKATTLNGDPGHDMNVRAITIRVLQDVDLEKINVNRWDGRSQLPLYEIK